MAGHDRRRRERRARLEQFIEETEEGLGEETETGTFEDLIVDDQFFQESGTLTVTARDLPVEIGANPLPFPLQGIRRLGAVVNFNFVWDPDIDKWVRDTGAATTSTTNGTDGGGTTSEVSGATITVPASKATTTVSVS